MKLVNIEEMHRIEQAADAGGHSYAAMMDMAGRAVATVASTLMLKGPGKKVVVLVGPGNNGGDGLVAAHDLLEGGHEVIVYIWKRDTKGDAHLKRLRRRRRGIAILWSENDPDFAKLRQEVQSADLVIDSLLGTGVTRPMEGRLAELITLVRSEVNTRRSAVTEESAPSSFLLPRFPVMEALGLGEKMASPPLPGVDSDDFDGDELPGENGSENEGEADDWDDEWDDELDEEEGGLPVPIWPQPPILAVDCPSGLDCDTGAVDPLTLRADATVTFGFPKWGQLQYPGAGRCGLLSVADIGVPSELAENIHTELIGPDEVRRWLPAHPSDAHKGTFGKVMVVAGSLNYTGAAYLSSAAAARAGAGLVTLAVPMPLHAVLASALPEVTWLPLPGPAGTHTAAGVPELLSHLETYDALLVGPGLTTSDEARAFIQALFSDEGLPRPAWQQRTIVDADALNILATLPDWPALLPPQSILTPHPGEMSRLTGKSPDEINAQRIATAQRYSAEWGHHVLLKGAHTVIASPDGRAAVLPFALSVLATAGSGDVLAGAIAAMLAQGVPAYEAAICGAYLHGHAGVRIARSSGIAGGIAGDLVNQFPRALRNMYTGS